MREELNQYTPRNFIKIITYPGVMGEEKAKEASIGVKILLMKIRAKTTDENTKKAVELLADEKVNLIVFIGDRTQNCF